MTAPDPWNLEPVACAVCGTDRTRDLGVRGNREHAGADPTTEPHIVTNVVQCRDCGFIYTNPMIRGLEHLELAHYSDPDVYEFAAGGSVEANVAQRLEMIRRLTAGRRLLDVGAGKGEFVAGAVSAQFDAVGVEPSARFCEVATDTLGVTMLHGTLTDLGLDPGQFDVVTAMHVLEHVGDPHAFVSELTRVAVPGGLIVIEVPNGDARVLRAADAYHRLRGRKWSTRVSPTHPPFHRVAHTRTSLSRVLTDAGLAIEQVTTISGLSRDVSRPAGRGRLEWSLRTLAARALDVFGHREMLFVAARVPRR